jgi:gluconokinase
VKTVTSSDGQIEATAARAPFVLALDTGTSSGRAALFDADGREISGTFARVEWSFQTTREGGAEVDADWLLAQTARILDETLRRIRQLNLKIEAIAVSCFWHSLVGVDSDGRALTPLYGWADTRAALEVLELRRRFDERAMHARTGCRFHASYWPAKLLWLQRVQPDAWRSGARWLSFGEFLTLRFCGVETASVSQASATGLLDLRRLTWDEELCAALKLKVEQLPPLAQENGDSFQIAGAYAERWPELKSRPWFAAVGDGAANNIGAGCVNRSALALMIGTSGAMRVLYEGEPPAELPESLWCYRADRRRVLVGGALSDGGGLYDWMRDSFHVGDSESSHAAHAPEEEVARELAALAPDAHGLTILPFWAGERSTNWNPQATGAITGLTMHTRPVEIIRAALEAVAYRFAHIARALDAFAPGAEVRASGGALAASPLWAQMLADVLARPVKVSTAREASSRGAALLALESLGVIDELTDAPAEFCRTFTPDMRAHEIYRAGAERQETIYQSLFKDA